jgi:glycerol-3-phosphate dehydrogenase
LLEGNSFKSESDLYNYIVKAKDLFTDLDFEPNLAPVLIKRYGDKIDIIIDLIVNKLNVNDKMECLLEAEIKYGIYHEMIYFPTDFVQRQTGMLWFDRPLCISKKNFILDVFALEFQWDDKIKSLERKKLDQLLDTVLDFKD